MRLEVRVETGAGELRGVVVLGLRGAQLPDGLSVWPDR